MHMVRDPAEGDYKRAEFLALRRQRVIDAIAELPFQERQAIPGRPDEMHEDGQGLALASQFFPPSSYPEPAVVLSIIGDGGSAHRFVPAHRPNPRRRVSRRA
jgi:hypothetical protein